MSPNKPPRQRFNFNASQPIRLLMVVGALLVIIIFIAIVKSIFFGGGSNWQSYINVAEQQQQMIHLAIDATQQQNLPASTNNFAITAQTTLVSSQKDLLSYLGNNHIKVKSKTLVKSENPMLDTQLATAKTDNTYDQVFRQIMHDQISKYRQELKAAYSEAKGPKGRQLMSDTYDAAGLLLQQLNTN